MQKKLGSFWLQLLTIVIVLCTLLFTRDAYIIHITILCMIYGTVASNWNIAVGYTGLFHLAQVPFFVLGAYTTAILTAKFQIPSLIGLLISTIPVIALSVVVGALSLRVKGIYLLFTTLALHFVMRALILYFSDWTGGDVGLIVPPLKILDIQINQFDPVPSFIIALTFLVMALIQTKKISDSRLGLALRSLRDSEVYAISRGVNPYKTKLTAFVLSSWQTALCGAFYAHYLGVVGPWDLGWGLVITFLTSMILGGLGTLYGPFLGTFVLIYLNEYFRIVQTLRPTIYGVLLIVTLIIFPSGLISIVWKLRNYARKYVKTGS